MIHVETFCKASKLEWIKRIYDAKINNSWKILVYQIFNESHIGCIFESSKQNLTDIASSMTNVFWKEVIQTWIFNREITNINQNSVIPNTVICSSGHIKNNNLLLKRNYYMQKGLIYVKTYITTTIIPSKPRKFYNRSMASISLFSIICA